MAERTPAAERQLPLAGEIFLDHVADFVADADSAAHGLTRAGFQPTPSSIQRNPDGSLTGTGNVTAMLARGYLEMLFKTSDTDLGRELDQARARYHGIHLIAFSVADAKAERERIAAEGFRVRPIAEMSRPVPTEDGQATAAFTVTRVDAGVMREGRIQILTHHTEDAVWQKRWLAHPNGARALLDIVAAVDDVEEAAARYAKFTGRKASNTPMGRAVALDRGGVQFMSPANFREISGIAPPSLPFIGMSAIGVASLAQTESALRAGGINFQRRSGLLTAQFPDELGIGAWMFTENAADLPWRRQS